MAEIERFWERHPRLLASVWGTGAPGFSSKEKEKLFLLQAAAAGISRPESMLRNYSHYSPQGGKDMDWAIARFAQVNNLTQQIWSRAQEINPGLYEQLVTPKYRNGRNGQFEPENVPESYQYECPPVATPAGWAVPRLLILLSEKGDIAQILDDSLRDGSDPDMLLCIIAEKIHDTGIEARKIMDLVLKRHTMEEQNSQSMYFEVIDKLQVAAPHLWQDAVRLYETENKNPKSPGWVGILNRYKKRGV